MKEGVLANTATMETKLIFQGNNLHNKIEEKKEPGKEAMVISYSDGFASACKPRGRLISIRMQLKYYNISRQVILGERDALARLPIILIFPYWLASLGLVRVN